MLLLRTPTGPVSAVRYITKPKPTISSSDPWLIPTPNTRRRERIVLALSNSNGNVKTTPSPSSSQIPSSVDETVLVGQENVPLEGVIQFDKPSTSSSSITKWGRVALLAGGDVLALLIFSAIGRFSHGFPVFSIDTLHTADPFIAGWFLSAYFLGGYAEEGRGMKGRSKAVVAAAKSWVLGAPLGMIISVLPTESKKKDDTYRKGSAFELFELLTSLIRRW
ncbi:hypothetical protein V5N11_012767 [Cardamine amara subsp. amara]|uniref:Uncharacterized protein n=1 Tax=Cardamine amara subsp. amara TaxID=228776 RepID=A0ABD0ZI32_CARAN